MNIPTKRVIYRPDGREMTINSEDFDPKLHAEPGEKVLAPGSEVVVEGPPDFLIADAQPEPEPEPTPEPEPPVEPIEEHHAGKGKGKGKK
jgi:hypothetical protein